MLAFAGRGPARASSQAGVARSLPVEFGRRDGSGAPLAQRVDLLGGSLGAAGITGSPSGGQTAAADAATDSTAPPSAPSSAAGSPSPAAAAASGMPEGLPAPEPARAPLSAPVQDSIPFGDPGVVDVD